MKVLGIETSCDETAAAVVEDGFRLLSNVVASSADLQAQYGGVVPELAARSHIEAINGVVQQALDDAGCTWADVDAIAVTYGPGLGGSLLIGVLTARTLAIVHGKPLYAINHVEAHVYANFLTEVGEIRDKRYELREGKGQRTKGNVSPATNSAERYALPQKQPTFPMMALIVSGGHSQLVLFRGHFEYTLLGQTQDDAIGEAFDKVAKIIGLPYPGGPSVGKKALEGNAYAFELPKAKMTHISQRLQELRDKSYELRVKNAAPLRGNTTVAAGDKTSTLSSYSLTLNSNPTGSYDFSYSGVKTAVLRTAQAAIGEDHTFPSKNLPERLSEAQKADIAASFQRVAIETVVDKTITAYEEFTPASVVIAGGVAASPELRRQLSERLPCPTEYTDIRLCTDNGAMIATLGCFHVKYGRPTADPYTLDIAPSLSM